MSSLDAVLDTPFAYHLGWTLVHFLWQGALVGIAYAVARRWMGETSPQARYWLSLGTLAVLAALPVYTFIHLTLNAAAQPIELAPEGAAAGTAVIAQISLSSWLRELLRPLIPWTVPAWCAGVALLGLRAFASWHKTRRLLRESSGSAPAAWQLVVARLSDTIGVRIHVQVLMSTQVDAPCVLGWLKPVILLPPSVLTGLSPLQLEMVLAHELAHIRRYDYLVNLLQVGVETLLFYHPVVRWVSRDVRRERELCCDDAAVKACGDALHYAHALADLEGLRASEAMALGINGGELTLRVERLIAPHHVQPLSAPRVTSMMLASALFFSALLALASGRHMPSAAPLLQALHLPHAQTQATPVVPQAAPVRRSVLAPTRVRLSRPQQNEVPQVAAVDMAVTDPGVELVSPPAEPVLAVAPLAPAPEVHQVPTGPMKIIKMNNSNVQSRSSNEHDYCEPLTGSRVCRNR